MNLGKYDFFPAASGKGNVVAYLQASPEACVTTSPLCDHRYKQRYIDHYAHCYAHRDAHRYI